MALLLALDFGGTKLAAATLAQGERSWRGQQRVLTRGVNDAGSDWNMMTALAEEVLDGERPAAIGVSFGGPVAHQTGRVLLSHHVAGWEDTPLAARLHTLFGAPVSVDNDANAGALGEHRYGAGRGKQSLLYVTVSTGVGGGWILDGRIWRGGSGMAGEIGHTVVDPSGPRCLCGKRGCVERLASGPYMAETAREKLRADPGAGGELRRLAGDRMEAITGELLSRAAARGDRLAAAVLEAGGRALGVGLGNAANLVDPGLIVLGGGVTRAGAPWWQAVRAALEATTLPQVEVTLAPSQLGDEAPLWGAAALAQQLLS